MTMHVTPAAREFHDRAMAARARMAQNSYGAQLQLQQVREQQTKLAREVQETRRRADEKADKEARAAEDKRIKAIVAEFKLKTTPQAFNQLPRIMREVAEKHGFTVEQVKSHCRQAPLVRARQEFFYRARTETKKSFPEIGRFCGGRDHTTALHGFRKYQERQG